ncbi:DNA repair exonuclease [bacterium]|nr:DNA repair exonuclease [bacterium]
MKPPLKFLHTADLHLGAKFVKLGGKGVKQRKRLCQVFLDIVDLAIQEKVDVVLLAGDTFDNQHPSPDSLTAFRIAMQRLEQAEIPVIMIGGTHDYYDTQGILARVANTTSETFVVLHADQSTWISAAKQVVVHGISLEAANVPDKPLSHLHRSDEPFWHIGMAHAALAIGQEVVREATFTRDEVKATGMDYLALGHWHRARDCSAGNTVCWYSGSPEMIALDEEEPGQVLVVECKEKSKPKVTAYTVGKRSCVKLSVAAKDPTAALAQARQEADPDRILDLTLTGIIAPKQMTELLDFQRQLQDQYFFVQIRSAVVCEVAEKDLKQYSEQTVIGRFVRLVQERKKTANSNEKAELDNALQLGLALLAGHEVLTWS